MQVSLSNEQVAPVAPILRRVVERIHASLRNSWAEARAGAPRQSRGLELVETANPVSPTNSSPCPLSSAGDPPLKRAMRVRFPSRRPVFCRVVQSRTVRLIHGVALDERQDRERYPARQPLPVRRSERSAFAWASADRRASLRLARRSPWRRRAAGSSFPFIVQETGRGPAKPEIEVQVLVRGPLFPRVVKLPSCGASNAGLRVGVPPRGPLPVAEQFRLPPSKRIDAGANPAGGTFGGDGAKRRWIDRRSTPKGRAQRVKPAEVPAPV